MRVLIACPESQTECMAFRALGHEAYSCDVQEPSGGHHECSECHETEWRTSDSRMKWCMFCGAKMDGEVAGNEQ